MKFKISLLILVVGILFVSSKAHAAVSSWQKGATIQPQSTTDFGSSNFDQSLNNLRATGANYVTLVIPYYQDNTGSTTLYPISITPTDDSLIAGINYAHSIGLAVNLNIHAEISDGTWRAYINPADRSAWFTSYGTILNHYANLAQTEKVEMFTLGAEMIDMTSDNLNSTNTSNWLKLIANVRNLYSGKVTYDGNWGGGDWNDELDHIKFWNALDYIGVSAYYHIGGDTPNSYTPSSLQNAWNQVDTSQLSPLHQQYGKQIIFTEVGYRSVDGALTHPASWQINAAVDQQEQADGYQSLFAYWNNVSYFTGVQFWDWKSNPNAGGANDSDFTPQNKLAQTTMTNWFTYNQAQNPNQGPVSGTTYLSDMAWQSATNGWGPVEKDKSNGEQAAGDGHTITINGQTYAKGLGTNAPSKIVYAISNCTNFSSDIGVDDEVVTKASVNFQVWSGNTELYDSGLMTFADPAKTVSLNIAGVTSLALVVTDGGNGNAKDHADWANARITCNTSAPNPPPPPTQPNPPPPPPPPSSPPPTSPGPLDIWWPSNGGSVSGVQPFKAMVENIDVSQYQMYWQVDGGQLNLMNNSSTDYPHKEVLVDVSGWNWRSNNQYTINFVAKDSSGNIIAQKSTVINVTH